MPRLSQLVLIGTGNWVLDLVVTVATLAKHRRRRGLPGPPGVRHILFVDLFLRLQHIFTASLILPADVHTPTLEFPHSHYLAHNGGVIADYDDKDPFIDAPPSSPGIASSSKTETMDQANNFGDPLQASGEEERESHVSTTTTLVNSNKQSPSSKQFQRLPLERIGTQTTNTFATMESPTRASFDASEYSQASSPTKNTSTHNRSMSLADLARQGKRFSLNFPIQTDVMAQRSPTAATARSRPTSWAMASPMISPVKEAVPATPTEGSFLTIIASHERRVLELKEELRQAEEELKRLKKHYADHEAHKKRNETVRRVQQLQPLNTGPPFPNALDAGEDDPDGSTLWLQREMERRKTLLGGARSSNRKVFSGSRHTRTLSLLSPERMHTPSFPQPADIRDGDLDGKGIPPLSRPQTTTEMTPPLTDEAPLSARPEMRDRTISGTITKEALLKTGKQMAADLKEGLWTFVEDLRQATVGEEGVNGTTSRTASTTTAPNNKPNARPGLSRSNTSATSKSKRQQDNSALIDVGNSFWRDHGLDSPPASPAPAPKKSTKPTASKTSNAVQAKKARPDSKMMTATPQKPRDFEDSWDTWDTPLSNAAVMRVPNSHSTSDNSSSAGSTEDDEDDEDDDDTEEESNNSSARTSASLQHGALQTPKVDGLLDVQDGKKDSIPWPALVKLSPSHLKRTASHLMSEWEKSLTPPANEREGKGYLDGKQD